MTTVADLFYVALFAVALPLWDALVFWPAFRRRVAADPARARLRLWRQAIGFAWPLVAVGAALWMANERTWTALGLAAPHGWRAWGSVALLALLATYYALALATLARSSEARATLRQQIGELATLMPQTRTELAWFSGVSLSAGFCEEFLYRGYFVWALTPWLGWWGAAALSLAFFAAGHLYQGWSGVFRTGAVGALYTLVVALFGSLWPAIALHALVDLGSGAMAWRALSDRSVAGEAAGLTAEAPPGGS
jgi:uncharacterized protein